MVVPLDLKLTLPEEVASEAEANGLLVPEVIERLLRDELRRRRVDALFAAADRLSELDIPPLTDSEVEAEIEAVRERRRASNARRS